MTLVIRRGRGAPWTRAAMAARLDAALPELRGRDRLLGLVRGRVPGRRLKGRVRLSWGPGLVADINDLTSDGSLLALHAMQWAPPALAPVLQVCLRPGALFVDVGANIGIYTTWAAKLVGRTGLVLSFEPVEATWRLLADLCSQNRLEWVSIIAAAVGDGPGTARMDVVKGASGRSRISEAPFSPGQDLGLEVEVVTLDEMLVGRCPSLIKIDVEGRELEVLQGARATLAGGCPVVFEAPEFGGGRGTQQCIELLEGFGYEVYGLTPQGLKRSGAGLRSHNLLAVIPGDPVLSKLRDVRFRRNQTV